MKTAGLRPLGVRVSHPPLKGSNSNLTPILLGRIKRTLFLSPSVVVVANDLAKVGARVQFPSRALEVHTAMLHWSAKPRVMGSSPIVLIGRDVAQSVEQDKNVSRFAPLV